jgi:hemerythrin-like domain-containing protein
MGILIGARRESDFSDPVGMLGDCHRRIERFLGVLARVAGELRPEQRDAMETALRYFREAAPKHTADEEESLFPRLRRMADPQVLSRMEELNADHGRADNLHRSVDELGRLWLSRGWLEEREAARLVELVAALGELYREHIAMEEREVFPAASAALTDAERREMGAEMRGRRGV